MTETTCLEAALKYHELGWAPLPIKPGTKSPYIKWADYQHRQPTTDEILSWWTQWPDAQVAVVTGHVYGFFVLDIELRAIPYLNDKDIPSTPCTRTGGGGLHFFFKYPDDEEVKNKKHADGVDIKGDGGYVLVPPSSHPSGGHYEWINSPHEMELAPKPEWLILTPLKRPREKLADVVYEGERNVIMTQWAGKIIRKYGAENEEPCWNELKKINQELCNPPLHDAELRKIFDSIMRREREKLKAIPVPNTTWNDVEKTFKKWLALSTMDPVRLLLATIIANRMTGDPVWLFIVAASSWGKTELISSLLRLPDTFFLSSLTPQTLISGKVSKDGKDNSLLFRLDRKILTFKDFAPVLELHRESRQLVFTQLRDIYDGCHIKGFGSDKRVIEWRGKVGFIAGVTQGIDQYTSLSAVLGERYLQYHFPSLDEDKVIELAENNIGREKEMREELSSKVAGFMQTIKIRSPQDFIVPPDLKKELHTRVKLVIRGRAGVIRDNSPAREIVDIHDYEGPPRLLKQLYQLMYGLATQRGDLVISPEDCNLVLKVGWNSIPRMRRKTIEILEKRMEWTTADVAIELGLSTTGARRHLEDLAALKLVIRGKEGDYATAPDTWSLAPIVREMRRTKNEKPDYERSTG